MPFFVNSRLFFFVLWIFHSWIHKLLNSFYRDIFLSSFSVTVRWHRLNIISDNVQSHKYLKTFRHFQILRWICTEKIKLRQRNLLKEKKIDEHTHTQITFKKINYFASDSGGREHFGSFQIEIMWMETTNSYKDQSTNAY